MSLIGNNPITIVKSRNRKLNIGGIKSAGYHLWKHRLDIKSKRANINGRIADWSIYLKSNRHEQPCKIYKLYWKLQIQLYNAIKLNKWYDGFSQNWKNDFWAK